MQGTLCALQRLATRTDGTLRQLRFGGAGDPLEDVVAGIAEVGGAEAEVDSHRATIAALVLQKISSMLGTHLHTERGGGREGRRESVLQHLLN